MQNNHSGELTHARLHVQDSKGLEKEHLTKESHVFNCCQIVWWVKL